MAANDNEPRSDSAKPKFPGKEALQPPLPKRFYKEASAETRDGTKVALENVTRTGRTIQCEWYNTPLVDPGGRVVGFASLANPVASGEGKP